MARPRRPAAKRARKPTTERPLKRDFDHSNDDAATTIIKRPCIFESKEVAVEANKAALQAISNNISKTQIPKTVKDFHSLMEAVKTLQEHGIQWMDNGWLIMGMKVPLKHYQVVAVAWGVQHMQPKAAMSGCILGDVMGLGKTVQALAMLVVIQWSIRNAWKRDSDTLPQRHLVVVPRALRKQWLEEAHKMVYTYPEWEAGKGDRHKALAAKPGFTGVESYDTFSRMKMKYINSVVQQHDLIIATYEEVRSSFPSLPKHLKTEDEIEEWMTDSAPRAGPLHQIQWSTVVYDEADRIRNPWNRLTCACRTLQSRSKLPMSGTLTVNGVADLWVPLDLVGCRTLPKYDEFRDKTRASDTGDSLEKATNFIRPMLEPYIMARTVHDTFLGQPLLNIPAPLPALIVFLEFNETERKVNDVVYDIYSSKAARALRYGQDKRYVLSMTTPMRLGADHILLLEDRLTNKLDLGSLSHLSDEIDNISEKDGMNIMIQMGLMFEQAPSACSYGQDYMEIRQSNITKAMIRRKRNAGASDLIGGMHGAGKLEYKGYFDDLRRGDDYDQITENTACGVCTQPPTEALIAECRCIYCTECWDELRLHNEILKQQMRCQQCEEVIEEAKPCVRPLPEDKRTGGDVQWVQKFGKSCKPSAKTSATVALCRKWLSDKTVKILVFSHFVGMLDFVGIALETNKIKYAKYHGSMKAKERDQVIADFKGGGDVSVLLMSTKAGAVGLNLTVACKVIILDPWWNDAVEQQAFGRVFRHGQLKTTQVVRFIVRDSIDEFMMTKKLEKLRNLTMIAGLSIPMACSDELQDVMEYFGVSGEIKLEPFEEGSHDDGLSDGIMSEDSEE